MRSRRGPLLATVLALAVIAPRAAADPTREDRAAATALFDEGRKLAAAKKYADACPKFEAAMRLDPGMGTLFNLSDCFEHIGRTASAWSGFRDVAAQAKAASQPDREKAARDRAAALEPKLARVRFVLPKELAGESTLVILRDGSPVPAELAGTPIPLDPGPHTLRVEAQGRAAWETSVTLTAAGGTMDIAVPVLAVVTSPPAGSSAGPSASGAPGAGPSASSAAPPATASAAPAPGGGEPVRPWQKPLGIAAAAVGVAALGGGVVLGVLAKGQFDESNKAHCDAKTNVCDDEGKKMRLAAVDQGNIGTALGIAGAVVGAAGIVLWIAAPSAPAAPAKAAGVTGVRVEAGVGSIVVRGRF